MTIVSLAALTVLDLGPAGQIAAAAAAGFTHVGLRLQPLLESDAVVVGDGDLEAEVAGLLTETGLQLLEVGVFPIRAGFDFAAWEPVIAYSSRLGGRFLVCPVETSDTEAQISGFRKVSALARRYGMTALVEFNPYSGCNTLDGAVRLIEGAGEVDTGLVIDVFHLSRSGGHPDDLKKLGPGLVRLVHFCDAGAMPREGQSIDAMRRESRTARMLPGEGELWLEALLDAVGPEVPLSVEAPSQSLKGLDGAARAKRVYQATMAVLAERGL